MARHKRPSDIQMAVKQVKVPRDDTDCMEWFDRQQSIHASVRWLIKQHIARCGCVADVFSSMDLSGLGQTAVGPVTRTPDTVIQEADDGYQKYQPDIRPADTIRQQMAENRQARQQTATVKPKTEPKPRQRMHTMPDPFKGLDDTDEDMAKIMSMMNDF